MQEVGLTGEIGTYGLSGRADGTDRQRRPQFALQSIWDFEFDAADVIDVAFDIDRISDWCGNIVMKIETIEDRDGDVGHHVWAHTKGWLPHSFIFSGTVTRLEPERLMDIAIHGDFNGTAGIAVEQIDCGTRVTFSWRIDCKHRLIEPVSRIVPPLFVWNHRWAMRRAFRAMQAELARRRDGENKPRSDRPSFPHNITLLRNVFSRRRETMIPRQTRT